MCLRLALALELPLGSPTPITRVSNPLNEVVSPRPHTLTHSLTHLNIQRVSTDKQLTAQRKGFTLCWYAALLLHGKQVSRSCLQSLSYTCHTLLVVVLAVVDFARSEDAQARLIVGRKRQYIDRSNSHSQAGSHLCKA